MTHSQEARRIELAAVPPPGEPPYCHLNPLIDKLEAWGHQSLAGWRREPHFGDWYYLVEGSIDVERVLRTFVLPDTIEIAAMAPRGQVMIEDELNCLSILDAGPTPSLQELWTKVRRRGRK